MREDSRQIARDLMGSDSTTRAAAELRIGEMAFEVERLREAVEASDALFAWLQKHYPNGLMAAPMDIMRRLQRAREALNGKESP